MKRVFIACGVVAGILMTAPLFAQGQSLKAKAQNVPEIPYESVPNFLKLLRHENLSVRWRPSYHFQANGRQFPTQDQH